MAVQVSPVAGLTETQAVDFVERLIVHHAGGLSAGLRELIEGNPHMTRTMVARHMTVQGTSQRARLALAVARCGY